MESLTSTASKSDADNDFRSVASKAITRFILSPSGVSMRGNSGSAALALGEVATLESGAVVAVGVMVGCAVVAAAASITTTHSRSNAGISNPSGSST